MPVPQYAEAGTWTLLRVHLEDAAGNAAELAGDEVRRAGFPVLLDVTGEQDAAPPSLVTFAFAPASVDVRAEPQTVGFDLSALDSLSGVGSAVVSITSPSRVITLAAEPCARRAGTPEAGDYDCSLTLPRYVEEGAWAVAVELTDRAGNSRVYDAAELKRRGFQGTLPVTSTVDGVAPSLARFSFSPDSVTVTASVGAVAHATVRALDGISGVAAVSVGFVSPSEFHAAGGCGLTSGTTVDGTWDCDVEIDPGAETGTWTATLQITDQAGNVRAYTGADLAELGYPVALKVGNPIPPPPLEDR